MASAGLRIPRSDQPPGHRWASPHGTRRPGRASAGPTSRLRPPCACQRGCRPESGPGRGPRPPCGCGSTGWCRWPPGRRPRPGRRMVMRPAHSTPRRPSSARPRVMRAAREESPSPRPVGDARGDGQHVLGAPAISQPTTSGLVYTRKVSGRQQLLHPSAQALVGHGHDGGRGLAGDHLRRQVGAGEHADRAAPGAPRPPPRSSVRWRSLLQALGQADHRGPGVTDGARSAKTARKPWEGTAMITRSAPSTASSRTAVASRSSGRTCRGDRSGCVIGPERFGQLRAPGPQHGGGIR